MNVARPRRRPTEQYEKLFGIQAGDGAAAPETNIWNDAMTRVPHRKPEPSAFRRPNARAPQNAQRNYEHYLALALAETLTGDRISAENYFQHAEHYLRSMNNSN
jgi:hypothetical protein